MYVRSGYAGRALSRLARSSTAPPLAEAAVTAKSEGCDGGYSTAHRISSVSMMALAALAHLASDAADSNGGASCKGGKMIWVESYGKKVGERERNG